ncbi:MAG: DUF4062 domain-containing protein [Terriglobia bacterium]|jgi:hypothetical protein
MGDLATDIRVFLSSTFIDLKDLRQEIANRLRQIFGAQLLTMETFGSDEAPPEISSVRRVRECDVFIAIYAHRYGTVDAASGKSITELELDEAERAFSAGNIIGILIYVLAKDASWPSNLREMEPAATERLSRLKQRARLHTITPFHDREEVLFSVIRDVLSKIRSRLGAAPARRRHFSLPPARRLGRPLGMEFLTSADRQHLFGRNQKVNEVLDRVNSNPITLLLGDSGSGKTSLIHAGLFPAAIENGWLPIYTRPLGLPRSDVATALLASMFEGSPSYRGSLVTPLEQAISSVQPLRLMLIIDQFEDVLIAREQNETERLVDDLRTIGSLNDTRMCVLISYRADLEARLGELWQRISGSAEGLARVYIAGIDVAEAWRSVERACEDLQIRLELADAEVDQVEGDLLSFSTRYGGQGVYPPYIQMFVDHVWRKASRGVSSYRFEDYLADGGMEGVTGGYLTRQLAYAQDPEGRMRAVLVSLVRSYGVKAQKSLAEVAADVGLNDRECEVLLERIIDLRLVRHIRDLYEVTHDFLAHEISSKLVDSEELEFKRSRELLGSNAAAFNATRSLLTAKELLTLFQFKERVLPSNGELRLILASWAREAGPGLFWLLNSPPTHLLEMIRAEETEPGLETENRAVLALLRAKVSGTQLLRKDWSQFRAYRLRIELAALLRAKPLDCPDNVILWALRSKHRTVRVAAFEALAQKVANGHRKWIDDLWKSLSPFKRRAFELLSLREEIAVAPLNGGEAGRRAMQEFGLLRQIARSQTVAELRNALKNLRRFRPKARTRFFALGMALQRTQGLPLIVKRLPRLGASKCGVFLSSLRGPVSETDCGVLLTAYLHWNGKEYEHADVLSRRRRAVYEDKATALSDTLLRVATKTNLPLIRECFEAIKLTPSAQYYVLTLLRLGNTSDVLRIIRKVEMASYEIRYWFQIEMGQAIERRMAEFGGPIPKRLMRIQGKRGFWEIRRRRENRPTRRDLLPLGYQNNRSLYLRLVAHAIIGAAGKDDSNLLKKLAQHEYRMIARAGAIRLAELMGDAGITMLQSAAKEAIERGTGESLAVALRDAEIHRFGLVELW